MTTTNKGGRIPAPRNADECRQAISREVMFGGREVKIARLHRLLKTFERGETAAMTARRVAAQESANALKAADIELRRQEYLRRFAAAPLGQRMLLSKVARLEEEVRMLQADRRVDAA